MIVCVVTCPNDCSVDKQSVSEQLDDNELTILFDPLSLVLLLVANATLSAIFISLVTAIAGGVNE